ncbi:hypothetical protein LPJ66_000926 [Kickxella alabastrina]|uniref:Uncharacterized protein n=1 Tax=Kickxella alabastrina TaxID=61397 RepID=A0ACC1IUN3_9FUNG|nr:hypothetical protein LPJ66_000926 [Kickxella alabastrina]
MYMEYRKRSLDLPVADNSQSTPKHPRNDDNGVDSNSNSIAASRPKPTRVLEPHSSASTSGPFLPPIRSLNEFTFGPGLPVQSASPVGFSGGATSIPSLRHLHSPPNHHHSQQKAGGGSGQRNFSQQRIMPPPSTVPPLHIVQLHSQPQVHQNFYTGGSQNTSLDSHLSESPALSTASSPQEALSCGIISGIGGGRPAALGHSDSAMSSSMTSHGGLEIKTQGASFDSDYNVSGAGGNSPSDAIKVARNWSRDETLSLVRAIGRHYDSLKSCKTNQERSSVWHRIHKEHSSQFPGRSKKASQDRWGKVLSDYKDVVIHNKEKGAARWTFDFFKEVASIVEGDAQFMDVSSPSTMSPPAPLPATSASTSFNLGTKGDHAHPFGGAVTRVGRPPFAYHRMSEPNLSIASSIAQAHSRAIAGVRPLTVAHQTMYSGSSASGGQLGRFPVVAEPPQTAPVAHGTYGLGISVGSGRLSPTRRTSYPQLQALTRPLQSPALGSLNNAFGPNQRLSHPHLQPHHDSQQQQQAHQRPQSYAQIQQQHQIQHHQNLHQQQAQQQVALSLPLAGAVRPSPPPIMPYTMANPPTASTRAVQHQQLNDAAVSITTPAITSSDSISEHVAAHPSAVVDNSTYESNPENACRYVMNILRGQMTKIDAQQHKLNQLKESTQSAISQVEHVMQKFIQP